MALKALSEPVYKGYYLKKVLYSVIRWLSFYNFYMKAALILLCSSSRQFTREEYAAHMEKQEIYSLNNFNKRYHGLLGIILLERNS